MEMQSISCLLVRMKMENNNNKKKPSDRRFAKVESAVGNMKEQRLHIQREHNSRISTRFFNNSSSSLKSDMGLISWKESKTQEDQKELPYHALTQ